MPKQTLHHSSVLVIMNNTSQNTTKLSIFVGIRIIRNRGFCFFDVRQFKTPISGMNKLRHVKNRPPPLSSVCNDYPMSSNSRAVLFRFLWCQHFRSPKSSLPVSCLIPAFLRWTRR